MPTERGTSSYGETSFPHKPYGEVRYTYQTMPTDRHFTGQQWVEGMEDDQVAPCIGLCYTETMRMSTSVRMSGGGYSSIRADEAIRPRIVPSVPWFRAM